MITCRVIRQWSIQIDGAICQVVRAQHDLLDIDESVLDQRMKLDGALSSCLSEALRRIQNFELCVFYRVRPESARHVKLLAFI
jgi:hypothetical protein